VWWLFEGTFGQLTVPIYKYYRHFQALSLANSKFPITQAEALSGFELSNEWQKATGFKAQRADSKGEILGAGAASHLPISYGVWVSAVSSPSGVLGGVRRFGPAKYTSGKPVKSTFIAQGL